MQTKWRSALFSIATVAGSTTLALIAADWIVATLVRTPGEVAAARAGLQWDKRDRLDVVMERRKGDPNWFPAVPANIYLERPLQVDGRRVLPLSGVANARVVGCNESGYYSTFSTDEFGFNNPNGALARTGKQIVFLGDSFTQGDCLRQGETIIDRIRALKPETINLGSGGNGPLLELAAIREYIRPGGTSVTVWMYYEGNDLEDLRRDRTDPLLSRYLEADFSQGLLLAQEKINAAVRSMVEARMAEQLRGRATFLPNLRELAWQLRHRGWPGGNAALADRAPPADSDATVALLLNVLAAARDEVNKKGGKLLFAYLPEYYRYGGPHLSWSAAQREQVLAGVRGLGIAVVDVHEEFRRQADPSALFPFGIKGHYNTKGAAVAAQAIVRALPE